MSEITVNLTLTFKIPDNGLNVNSLLFGLKKCNSRIMLSMVRALFQAIEEKAIMKLKSIFRDHFICYGHQRARTLVSSFGPFRYAFAQVKNVTNGKILVPLRESLNIPKYTRYQNDSMEDAVGLSVHLSYHRSNSEVTRIRGSGASKWTIRRRLHEFSQSQCQFGNLKKIPYCFLMVDGTKVHLQTAKGREVGQKQMRWALASTGVGQPFDIVGVWIDTSWEQIADDLKARLTYEKIGVLISDGGPGIQENFTTEGMRQQRCIFHGRRDFPFLLYADHIKKKDHLPFTDFLSTIPAMNISKKYLEKVTEKDKPKITQLCKRTKKDFKKLIKMLDPQQYPKSRAYIQNLSDNITVFFSWWLEKNEWIPFTSNLIENRFSQVKNRIKRIGRRWSDTGLEKWLMVTIKKIFYPNAWGQLWKQFLNINKLIQLIDIKVAYEWN
jgi:hypothetical protein